MIYNLLHTEHSILFYRQDTCQPYSQMEARPDSLADNEADHQAEDRTVQEQDRPNCQVEDLGNRWARTGQTA
jgi:hypothetical protein